MAKILHPIEQNLSGIFSLKEDIGRIQICGMSEGDCVCLETSICITDCEKKWMPYVPSCCGQQCYSYPQNQIYIPVAGEYRLRFCNSNGDDDNDESYWDEVEIFYDAVTSNQNIIDVLGAQNMTCCDKSNPSSMTSIFDGLKIGEHTSGEGDVTEIDIPSIKRNGESIPITIDPDTGKACINIIDEDTIDPNTDTIIVKTTETVENGVKTTCFDKINEDDNSVIVADYFCITSDVDTTIPDTVDPDTDTKTVWASETIANGVKTTCFDLVNALDNSVITPDVFCISSDIDTDTTIADTDTFGTWNGTTITFPDSTVYTPAPPSSVLVQGARDNTFRHQDGQGNTVTYTPNITGKCSGPWNLNSTNSDVLLLKDITDNGLGFSVPWIEGADECTPADPVGCLADMNTFTISPKGDIWTSVGGAAYTLAVVSANTDFAGMTSTGTGVGTFSAGGSVVLVDASATGGADEISPLIGSGETALATLERTITNNDCVDWVYRYDIRALAQWSGIGEGARVNLGIGATAAHTAQPMLGQPDDIFDTRNNPANSVGQESKDYLHTWAIGNLAPNASVTISAESFANVQDFVAGVGNTAAAGQSVSVNSLAGRVQVWRKDSSRNMI